MKALVITRHAISNYGSLLQAYATQKVLQTLGYECEIIDYIRDDESYFNREKTLLKRKKDWNKNPIKRFIYLMLRQPESVLSGWRFEKERSKILNLTERYNTYEKLKNGYPKADIYITGSDQVWGPTEDGSYDPVYCLKFLPRHTKKISYAASFGRTEMNDSIRNYYKENLSKYKYLTVREDSAVQLIQKFGLTVQQVIDPTLLLSSEEWLKLCGGIQKGKYILVYQLHNDSQLGVYAKKIAKAKGLPLIRLSTSFHQILRPGRLVWNPEITKFLKYIAGAECLITDSFHGTAFAINLNVQFIEILPNNSTGTRNQSILKLTGLTNRILTDVNDISLAFKKINYTEVNKIIQQERLKSIRILKHMLEA